MQNSDEADVVTADFVATPEPAAATPTAKTTATPAKVAPATAPASNTDPDREASSDQDDSASEGGDEGKAKADPSDPGPDEAAARERQNRSRRDRRIDRLTAKASAAEREAAYWRGVAEARAQAESLEPSQRRAVADPEPMLHDYDDPDEFAEARVAWKARQRGEPDSRTQGSASEPNGATPRETGQPAPVSDEARKSVEAARSQYEDFDDVVFDPVLPITQHMIEAIADLEDFGEVLYAFAQDADQVERISRLTPKQQARELWRFADQLAARRNGTEPGTDTGRVPPGGANQPQTRQQLEPGGAARSSMTKANPVPTHLQGGRAGSSDPFDPNVSDEASIELLNRQAMARGKKPWEA